MYSDVPQRLGKYALIRPLGQGGAARVFLATDTQLQRKIAIKVLHANLSADPNFLERFLQEARAVAGLRHPNIVQVHDFQIDDTQPDGTPLPYMVMDYIEGQTLADYIAKTSNIGRIPSSQTIVRLFTALGQAIDYAHSRSVIHCDIKPANILLEERRTASDLLGTPILTDFGLAKMMGDPLYAAHDGRQGTWLYLSPEQIEGFPASPASDLYALGIMLYEVVTGARPFTGMTRDEIFEQHRNVTPLLPSQINKRVPPELDQVIMRALAKDPQARYASANEMVRAIAQGLHVSLADSAVTPTVTPTVTPVQSVEIGGTSVHDGEPVRFNTPPTSGGPARRYVYGGIVLAALIIISGFIGYLYRPTQAIVATPMGPDGFATYVSSGQFDAQHAVGVADGLRIDLNNVANPSPGKSYHAWLLGDTDPEHADDDVGPRPIHPPLLLSAALPVTDRHIQYTYQGNQNHDDLLSATSRLLITEEDQGSHNATPSIDRSTWRYYAALPQLPIPGDPNHFSALVHLRHLFYQEVDIKVLGLNGGLDVWLFKNTEKVLELATSARDDWHDNMSANNIAQIKDLSGRILLYLDGTKNYHASIAQSLSVAPADRTPALIGLLTADPAHQGGQFLETNPPGYTDHVQLHVAQIAHATDITPVMHKDALQIVDALQNNIIPDLKQVQQDDVSLLQMADDQFSSTAARDLLDNMVMLATYAYIGKLDPVTDSIHDGVTQVHYNVQGLAKMRISPNLPSHL